MTADFPRFVDGRCSGIVGRGRISCGEIWSGWPPNTAGDVACEVLG